MLEGSQNQVGDGIQGMDPYFELSASYPPKKNKSHLACRVAEAAFTVFISAALGAAVATAFVLIPGSPILGVGLLASLYWGGGLGATVGLIGEAVSCIF